MSGDMMGFKVGLNSVSDATPTELAFVHRESVTQCLYQSTCQTNLIKMLHFPQGNSLLHLCCKKGHVDLVAELLKRGVNLDIVNKVIRYDYWFTQAFLLLIITTLASSSGRTDSHWDSPRSWPTFYSVCVGALGRPLWGAIFSSICLLRSY